MYAGAYASFYLIQGQKCKDKYELLCWKVDDEEGQVFNFWHQLDDQNLKDFYQMVQPTIKVNHLIYIPMHTNKLTLENILEEQ